MMALEDANKTHTILGAALEVHKTLGPGLLESAYQRCLASEFTARRIPYEKELPIHINYQGTLIDNVYFADFVVNKEVLVEPKCVEKILPIHKAQTLTYLKLVNLRHALLLNFNESQFKDGITRLINE